MLSLLVAALGAQLSGRIMPGFPNFCNLLQQHIAQDRTGRGIAPLWRDDPSQFAGMAGAVVGRSATAAPASSNHGAASADVR
jgi:hypothetical protein